MILCRLELRLGMKDALAFERREARNAAKVAREKKAREPADNSAAARKKKKAAAAKVGRGIGAVCDVATLANFSDADT